LNYLNEKRFRNKLVEFIRAKEHEKRTITEATILLFSDFEYEYNKTETFYSLREWLISLSKINNKTMQELDRIIFNWHTYWT